MLSASAHPTHGDALYRKYNDQFEELSNRTTDMTGLPMVHERVIGSLTKAGYNGEELRKRYVRRFVLMATVVEKWRLKARGAPLARTMSEPATPSTPGSNSILADPILRKCSTGLGGRQLLDVEAEQHIAREGLSRTQLSVIGLFGFLLVVSIAAGNTRLGSLLF